MIALFPFVYYFIFPFFLKKLKFSSFPDAIMFSLIFIFLLFDDFRGFPVEYLNNSCIFAPNLKFNQFIMKHYETVFILTPVLSDAQVEEAVKKVEEQKSFKAKLDGNLTIKKDGFSLKNKKA